MTVRLLSLTRKYFIFLVIMSLVSFFTIDSGIALAKHKTSNSKSKKSKKNKKSKRNYNPSLTRLQAIEMIKSNSDNISNLAGLEEIAFDKTTPSTDLKIIDQGEDLAELEKEDNVSVDMDNFKLVWLNFVDDEKDDDITESGVSKKEIMSVIMNWLGTPYHFGGLSDRGIDCSAFIQKVYLVSSQIMLPRTASEQYHNVGSEINRTNLKFGDLIFFHTRRSVYVSHVGIYLGDNLFAHSSSRYGVTVSSLESDYYNNRFIGAKRISQNDLVRLNGTK